MRAMVIPEVKPAIESIAGRWEQKVSPRRRHAMLQLRLGTLLVNWAGSRGEVGSEWRFSIAPEGAEPSSLVPDLAYVSFERLPLELGEAREEPEIAPDIAVEILSPGGDLARLEEKIAIYRSNGARLVLVVDPALRSIDVREADSTQHYRCPEPLTVASYPDLQIDTERLFAGI
jgi:Uma2 family endonuclease